MTTRICTFSLAGDTYALDALRIVEVLRHQPMTPVPGAEGTIAGLLNLRGQIITAIDLRAVLGLGTAVAQPMNVLVSTEGDLISLLVDAIGDVLEVDPGRMTRPPDSIEPALRGLIAGTYQLRDRLALVLDADRVAGHLDDPGAVS